MVAAPAQNGAASIDSLAAIIAELPDPEIPVITLGDLGILRRVRESNCGPVITLTPTYSGCPATEVIREQVLAAAASAGFANAVVEFELAPAWSSQWISERGRERLRDYGIAPPVDEAQRTQPAAAQVIRLHRPARRTERSDVRSAERQTPSCPRCQASAVEELSAYGSTPCKSLYRCLSCREPFDYFKPY